MLRPMISREDQFGMQFFSVSGQAGEVSFAPDTGADHGGLLRLAPAGQQPRIVGLRISRDVQKLYDEHGGDGLRRALNRYYDELEQEHLS